MSKKPDKTASKPVTQDAAQPADAPKKRSKVKLALFALVPIVLAGAGAFGWMHFMATKPAAVDTAHAAEGPMDAEHASAEHGDAAAQTDDDHGAPDAMHVAAVPLDVAAETSITHSYALSVLIAEPCGTPAAPVLKAASDKEAVDNGPLVNMSWAAAARRTAGITPKSCDYIWSEIETAEAKLAAANAPKAKSAPAH